MSQNNQNKNRIELPELAMNKARLEALSDGVFAIVMTLLVIEIKVPEIHHSDIVSIDTSELLKALSGYTPIFISYFLTFAIISVLWLSHHFLLHQYAKNIDRYIIQLNALFLCFVSLIPFSSHFLGVYFNQPLALAIFGSNMLVSYTMIYIMQQYILKAEHIENAQIPSRILKQGKIRMAVNIGFSGFGILLGLINTNLGLICLIVPVIFTVIPGMLTKIERLFGIEIR
jgi:uncharacterized membrane protein